MAEQKVDLNQATREELMQIGGIGESAADKIIAYREEYGGFESIDDLDQVEGFSEKMINAIRDQVTVGEYEEGEEDEYEEGEEEEYDEEEDEEYEEDEEDEPRSEKSRPGEEE